MMRHMPTQELLTTPQAGAILGKSARTIQRMADAGDLPYVAKLPGPNGAYLFDAKVIKSLAPSAPSTGEPTDA